MNKEPQEITLNLANTPRQHDPSKRCIGFSVDISELDGNVGRFSGLLEKYCALYLTGLGYKVEKKEVNDMVFSIEKVKVE